MKNFIVTTPTTAKFNLNPVKQGGFPINRGLTLVDVTCRIGNYIWTGTKIKTKFKEQYKCSDYKVSRERSMKSLL